MALDSILLSLQNAKDTSIDDTAEEQKEDDTKETKNIEYKEVESNENIQSLKEGEIPEEKETKQIIGQTEDKVNIELELLNDDQKESDIKPETEATKAFMIPRKITTQGSIEKNKGEELLSSALKALRKTKSLEEREKEMKNQSNGAVCSPPQSPGVVGSNVEILMRKVDSSGDCGQLKRQSARLSLRNSLEMVPEDKPIETNSSEPKENEKDLSIFIEALKKSEDFNSLKEACISSIVAVNDIVKQINLQLKAQKGLNNYEPLESTGTAAPPPPPPPGPPPPSLLAPKKLVITKVSKPTIASTATAAKGAVNLMDEIKKKQNIRKGRKSLKAKYENLEAK